MSSTRSIARRRRSAPPAFRRRWRRASSTACSAAAVLLAVAACGGSGEPEATRAEPVVPAALAADLAAQADEVAALLENGDPAGAQAVALELEAAVESATDDGRLPRPLARRLASAVDRLLATIPVVEEEPPEEEPAETDEESDDEKDEKKDQKKDEEKGEGKGEGEKKGHEDDLDTVTDVTETTEDVDG